MRPRAGLHTAGRWMHLTRRRAKTRRGETMRKFNVIRWPDSAGSWWLVEETQEGYTKGCYSPILELHPKWNAKREMAPTYENQIWCAAELLVNDGPKALENPHAMIGRDCNCRECFCCAAAFVLHQANLV